MMDWLGQFKMPKRATLGMRTSTITNAFVSGIVPCIQPSADEVREALEILGMGDGRAVCAYCGDPCSEWDHLNPLVRDKRPTGYISEIHNLVPCCGRCNQSKGNRPWRQWMLGDAKNSPRNRSVADLHARVVRLERYVERFEPIKIDFAEVAGPDLWNQYRQAYEDLQARMARCQELQDRITSVVERVAGSSGDESNRRA